MMDGGRERVAPESLAPWTPDLGTLDAASVGGAIRKEDARSLPHSDKVRIGITRARPR